ncbi:hypothetical protein [Erythrobacter litoralis]|uniref:Uncharacterized protein n=1 Tax=Erythrobacter litoralis (strain HTCC2594) TaxID=314225 RepID=Q2N868_ERYLH|nr:hypothetical protein [Erythrobacter litoralis]ABC64123.1 hypothetical protein ELI_10155 [Erythrobacter litoralis HTCC2594]
MIAALVQHEAMVLNVVTLLLFLIAIWKGRGPELACASTLMAMIVLDRGYHAVLGPSPSYQAIDPWHLMLDTAGLFVFLIIALKANRFYPMVMAAAQLVAFTAHIVRMMVEPVSSLSYYLLYSMPFWFQLFVLAFGLGRHASRVTRIGSYRDWRVQPGMRYS